MVQTKTNAFYTTPTACSALLFSKACPFADIYKEYLLIKKVQQYRKQKGPVKDLRLQSNIDHAKMIELQRSSTKHIELLGTIKQFDENLEASVSGISAYFQEITKYDKGIADKDTFFIRGELHKYENTLAFVEKKLNKDIGRAMRLMIVMVGANLAEQIIYLATKIAENCNPIKVIFTGVNVGDILEQTGKVADTATDVVKGSALLVSVFELSEDSQSYLELLIDQKQVTELKLKFSKTWLKE